MSRMLHLVHRFSLPVFAQVSIKQRDPLTDTILACNQVWGDMCGIRGGRYASGLQVRE